MRVALYVRVSTLDQNPDAQRRELDIYANRHKWEIVTVFEEKASGAASELPAMSRLLEGARKGDFETVLVWKLDRFGRSLINLLDNLKVLETERVRFIAVSQGIDTGDGYANPTAQFFLHIMAAVAELERGIIRERVIVGVKRFKADWTAGRVGKEVHTQSGKDLPTGRPPRVLDNAELLRLAGEGLNKSQIARAMNLPLSTVRKRLSELKARPPSVLYPMTSPLMPVPRPELHVRIGAGTGSETDTHACQVQQDGQEGGRDEG